MQKLRNIAIIAHVDHGKTTLVDKMIVAGHLLRGDANNGDLIMDNNDLERERGITILSKNVSVIYKDYKINIIDTPGHADFGGEVERVLNMCDGVLLLVDAFEGTMPQTRFVLQKALSLGKKPIVVVNKVDKPNCRPEVVNEQVFDLMFSLNATEEQLDYKTIYGSAKQGWMSHVWNEPTDSIAPLLEAIINLIPAWLSKGLTVAGNMLPAVGFAMILNMMAKKEAIPFVMIGYVLFAYLGMPTMAIAITAGAIALIVFFNQGKGGVAAEEEEVVFEDGI